MDGEDILDGREIRESSDPSRPGVVVGRYRLATTRDAPRALACAERDPGTGWFPALLSILPESVGIMEPGPGPRVVELAGLRLAPLICYEAVSTGFVRALFAGPPPDLLVNATQDAWFGRGQGPTPEPRS